MPALILLGLLTAIINPYIQKGLIYEKIIVILIFTPYKSIRINATI